jgi:hypothetical protein
VRPERSGRTRLADAPDARTTAPRAGVGWVIKLASDDSTMLLIAGAKTTVNERQLALAGAN